tara:strand:- start:28 stop:762 length:735 start_codon:yes stop_codon:yes gene_type:complete
MVIKATYYGANGWLIELDKIRILIDPWLNGDLTFPPGDWLIKGELSKDVPIPENIDYLLLTQGQPDHAHPPTLEKINKSIPVVASESATKVVRAIGFNKVKALKPGETFINQDLCIKATSGASVPNIENGYLINYKSDSIYIEPHGFLDKNIKPRNIDLIITPVIDFSLPFAGKFIKGKTVLPKLLKLFKPKSVLASTTGGDITFTGIINKFIKVDGSIEDADIVNNDNTKLINPVPLKQYIFN